MKPGTGWRGDKALAEHRATTLAWAVRLACVLLLGSASLASSESGAWRKYVAPGLELYSNASAERALQVAARSAELLEDYRHVGLLGNRTQGSASAHRKPVRLVLFADFASYLPYRIAADAPAFHIGGSGTSLVLLQDLEQDFNQVLAHEFFHVYTDHAGLRLPVWAAEGLADYFATMRRETAADGARWLVIGEALPRHLRSLQRADAATIDPASLLNITHESRYRGGNPDAMDFYAHCWLVAHMMMSDTRWSAQLPTFLEVLRDRTSEQAFHLTYGVDLNTLRDAIQQYRKGQGTAEQSGATAGFTARRVAAPADTSQPKSPATEVEMPDWELRLLLADVLAYRGRHDAASARYLVLRAEFPETPEIHESLGHLALVRKQLSEAAQHFAEAARFGSTNGAVYFLLATLRCGMQSEEASCMEWLEAALRFNPGNAEFRHYAVDFALNIRQFKAALDWMASAPPVEPSRRFDWLHKWAYAQYHLNDFDGARARIADARSLPLHAGQQKMLRDLERAIADREEFTLQMELLRDATQQGDEFQRLALSRILENFARHQNAVLEDGRLHEIRCEPSHLFLLVDTASGRRRLRVQDPMDLMVLRGSRRLPELELTCGPAADTPVRVGYVWNEGQMEGALRVLQFDPARNP
ncbi:MAG: hypothetical protein MUF01_10355 [Bryobacterales bacterium]|nr:hypothetical protein [Bryobacterales bacterium]